MMTLLTSYGTKHIISHALIHPILHDPLLQTSRRAAPMAEDDLYDF